jgi:hypothetical protein
MYEKNSFLRKGYTHLASTLVLICLHCLLFFPGVWKKEDWTTGRAVGGVTEEILEGKVTPESREGIDGLGGAFIVLGPKT